MCKIFKYYLSQRPFSLHKDQHRLNPNIIFSPDQSDTTYELPAPLQPSQQNQKHKKRLHGKHLKKKNTQNQQNVKNR